MHKPSIEEQVKAAMDKVQSGIDIKTQVKLNEIRHQALQARPKVRHNKLIGTLSAAAAVLMITMLLWQQQTLETETVEPTDLFADLDLLIQEAGTDFYQDLEFLTWLDENDVMEGDI